MVLIIGAGLCGLVAGYQLKKAGIPFLILEARNRIGGRIYTINSADDTPVEMGATWFGNQHTNVINLLQELNIDHFEQYMKGTSFFQAFSFSPPSAFPIPDQAPSYRISGGTSTIIDSLAKSIGKHNILLNQQVKSIECFENSVSVKTDKWYQGSKVIVTIPPKLWVKNILFNPVLPSSLTKIAQETHTWMEESIKVALTYKAPFWRANRQSGTLFSNSGPITEFYDHCNSEENKYALCGFVNNSYNKLNTQERKKLIVEQIINVFGNKANNFIDYNELVWMNEDKTFTENLNPLFPHQNNGNGIYRESFFNDCLFFSGTESAHYFPGYMEGAIVSANDTSKKITESINNI